MTSIRRVQTERLLEDTVYTLYAQGESPTFTQVATDIARYLSKFPGGAPLPTPLDGAVGGESDVDDYNRLLSFLTINLDVLYEASLRQVDDIVQLSSSLNAHLKRLTTYRDRVEAQIEDYLLGLYNTDGYYYSISDNFADTTKTDLTLTSAHVDTTVGSVMIPSNVSSVQKIPVDQFGSPDIKVEVNGTKGHPVEVLSPLSGALEDSLDNILWSFEVATNRPSEVVAVATIPISNRDNPFNVSNISITPYGSNPVQIFLEYRSEDGSFKNFGNKIQTGRSKMLFSTSGSNLTSIRITFRKTEPDYIENVGGSKVYKYLFGARELSASYKAYDAAATFVSTPVSIPPELSNDLVIDAVSLDVEEEVSPDTSIEYFVAADNDSGEFVWRQITAVTSDDDDRRIVRFNGATNHIRNIRHDPAESELELLPLVTTGATIDLNPNPLIIPAVDVYRIAQFNEEVIPGSLELLEGVNTTRIYSRDLKPEDTLESLSIWAHTIAEESPTLDFARIDSGNEFFYGGDVGAIGKDVLIETYLESDQSYPTFLEEFQKADIRSRTWDVRVFLNGSSIGYLPEGTDKAQLPWAIKQGLNHLVILVRIPADAVEPSAYMGALTLMASDSISNYGTVRLDKWNYVDFFKMKYNETGQPRTFSIRNGEIISRREPTANFQLRYAKQTGNAPDALRFRADLFRSQNSPSITPKLNSYRLRFSYGQED